ncbi:hypothetical protein L1887_39223 [Cichorium endivia]|nr:hypothetical protein L1887_39223 [Cichorium endivia]
MKSSNSTMHNQTITAPIQENPLISTISPTIEQHSTPFSSVLELPSTAANFEWNTSEKEEHPPMKSSTICLISMTCGGLTNQLLKSNEGLWERRMVLHEWKVLVYGVRCWEEAGSSPTSDSIGSSRHPVIMFSAFSVTVLKSITTKAWQEGKLGKKRPHVELLVLQITIKEKAGINSKDVILEIGPGAINLTKKLLEAGKSVVAVELDPRMILDLQCWSTGNHQKNMKTWHVDIAMEDVLFDNLCRGIFVAGIDTQP